MVPITKPCLRRMFSQSENSNLPWQRFNRLLFGVSVVSLLIGTLISGHLRDAIEHRVFPDYFPFSSLAHFVLFTVMALSLRATPFCARPMPVMAFAMFLALLTEGLQHFAIDRHPRLLDVGIDLSGALIGLAVVFLKRKYRSI